MYPLKHRSNTFTAIEKLTEMEHWPLPAISVFFFFVVQMSVWECLRSVIKYSIKWLYIVRDRNGAKKTKPNKLKFEIRNEQKNLRMHIDLRRCDDSYLFYFFHWFFFFFCCTRRLHTGPRCLLVFFNFWCFSSRSSFDVFLFEFYIFYERHTNFVYRKQ